MGAKIKYLASVNDFQDVEQVKTKVSAGEALLIGEYGDLNPLSVYHKAKETVSSKLFMEIQAKNKNRDLIASSMISACKLGFDGIVLTSGLFDKKPGMAKPVYDLDPSQMLKLAAVLREEKKIADNFLIGVRSPAGGAAAKERARSFLENKADFIVLAEPDVFEDLAEKTRIVEDL
ncbi:MAG: hypothetical protein GY754_09395 [bacterium]|nr:hypothetical protein [bacterium]